VQNMCEVKASAGTRERGGEKALHMTSHNVGLSSNQNTRMVEYQMDDKRSCCDSNSWNHLVQCSLEYVQERAARRPNPFGGDEFSAVAMVCRLIASRLIRKIH
jgi:hypothetical protein